MIYHIEDEHEDDDDDLRLCRAVFFGDYSVQSGIVGKQKNNEKTPIAVRTGRDCIASGS